MFETLPGSAIPCLEWTWEQIEPYYQDLLARPLGGEYIERWLADWTQLGDLIGEVYARLSVTVTVDTTDPEAEARFNAFLDRVHPMTQAADQQLKEKLLASGLEPAGFAVPLRKMRAEAALFCAENLPLLSQERKMASEYNRIIGAQTVAWEGEELTLQQLRRALQSPERARRERAWRLAS